MFKYLAMGGDSLSFSGIAKFRTHVSQEPKPRLNINTTFRLRLWKMLVQEYLKNKEYLRTKDNVKIDKMYQDICNCICQNAKKMNYPLCHTYSPTVV